MVDIASLNPPQRKAAEKIDGPLLLLAGAGTGKTRVITYRMAHMLSKGISAKDIVALTFTNKAAKEMKERVVDLCGAQAHELFVGTFHSYCIQILREYASVIGVPKRFTLLGSSDQVDLVAKALESKRLEGIYRAQDIHAKISQLKNSLLTPADLNETHFPNEDAEHVLTFKTIYQLYEDQLRLNHALDFDDCILKVALALKNHEDVRKSLHERVSYYLVDEFQDTNFAQLTLLRSLVNKKNNICVVGDDDQSIYSWRGAMYETLEKFEQLFPKTQMIKLEQNYRCTTLILDAANKVIKNNSQRKDKTLWSENHSKEPIILKACDDEADEAHWITKQILGLKGQGVKPSEIAILYRANNLARANEMALRENRIPYKVFGGQSFFEKREIKDFMAYLRLLNSPSDRLAFWRVINTPPRGLGLKSLETIEQYAEKSKSSPFKALQSMNDKLSGSAQKGAKNFIELFETFKKKEISSPEALETLCMELLKATKLVPYHQQKMKQLTAGLKKAETLKQLPRWLRNSAEQIISDNKELSITNLVEAITLSGDDKHHEEDDGNYVSLMSIHASKGLEFKYVFICGVEDDLLPHKNSVEEPNGIAEERRLFYVALTRAKERLFLSHCSKRSGGYQTAIKSISRFIDEIPEDLISSDQNFREKVEQSATKQREKTVSRLSNFRASLSDL